MTIVISGDSDSKHCEYGVVVRVGNTIQQLPLRLDLRRHSPDGFSWGYAGSGPAQLALALLAFATNDGELALKHYQAFKAQVVAKLPASWTMTPQDVLDWLEKEQSLMT